MNATLDKQIEALEHSMPDNLAEIQATVERFERIAAVLVSLVSKDGATVSAAEAEQRMIARGIPAAQARRFAWMGFRKARDELMPVAAHWRPHAQTADWG